MAKKILKGVSWPVLFVAVYILQIFVISNTTFFGVTGNLCLMAVVVITLMYENNVAYIAASICGITSDILFSSVLGKYVLIYVIVVAILIGLKKMYKQDSKMAIIIFSALGVIISEILMLAFNIMLGQGLVNIFSLIFTILKQCIVNVFLAFSMYLILRINK